MLNKWDIEDLDPMGLTMFLPISFLCILRWLCMVIALLLVKDLYLYSFMQLWGRR